MVFEPWVFRSRVSRASFPNIAYFFFALRCLLFSSFSAINKRPFSRHDVPCVLRLLHIATIFDCKRNRGKLKMF